MNAKGSGRQPAGESTLSIISVGTTVSGDIDCGGVLKIEGRLDGSVRRARQVMLANDGAIHGDIVAAEVVLGGVIDGTVTASERLELQPTAVVNGDINTKSIIVMEGARINGSLKMTDASGAGRPTDPVGAPENRGGRPLSAFTPSPRQ